MWLGRVGWSAARRSVEEVVGTGGGRGALVAHSRRAATAATPKVVALAAATSAAAMAAAAPMVEALAAATGAADLAAAAAAVPIVAVLAAATVVEAEAEAVERGRGREAGRGVGGVDARVRAVVGYGLEPR